MLRALCLDLMDTVLRDPYVEAIRAATGLDLATVARLRDPTAWPAFERGEITEAQFAARFWADPACPHRFDLDAFHRARREGYHYLPGMAELLDACAGKVRRYVLSNYPAWIDEVCATHLLDARVEGVYASHALGVRKPDARFYERFLEATGHAPASCLFVDDRAANCDAAARAGMRVHVFDGAAGLAARLRAEGIDV